MNGKFKYVLLTGVALLALLSGCSVDSNYTLDKIKDVDTKMTLFQNGLSLPLIKSTKELRAESIVNEIEDEEIKKMFKVSPDGKYQINVNGYENLDTFIEDFGLADAVKIDPVNVETKFSFELGGLKPEDFKSEAMEFGEEAKLPDLSGISDIKINPLNEKISAETGIAGTDFDIKVNVDPFKRNQTIFKKDTIRKAGAAAEALLLDVVDLPDSEVDFLVEAKTIPAFNIPSSIKEIKSVTLNSNAKLTIKLSLTNSLLSSGSVTPNISLDLSDLLTFEGGSGVVDVSSMVLNSTNNYQCSKDFPIEGVNLDKLAQSKSITFDGSLAIAGAKATTAKCKAATGDLGMDISIEMKNFVVESASCEIKELKANISKDVEIKVPDVALPKEVKSVDYVKFTDASNVTMNISATNLSKVEGATMTAASVKVTFPEGLEVSGADVKDNVLSLKDVNLNAGYNTVIKVTKLNLPAPKDGKIKYTAKINVAADCSAGGTINTGDLKKLSGEDISVTAKITSALKVEDFSAVVDEYKATVPETKGELTFKVPDEAASYGTFTITPEGTPSITIDMSIPDLGGKTISAGNGIRIQIPTFLTLGSLDPELGYDKTTNTLIINQIKNKKYSLPIEKIVAKAEKTATGYQVSGKYSVEGTLSVAEGTINKSTLDKISGAKLSFKAIVPALQAAKISVESLSYDVDEKVDFEVIKSKDIPEMLISIGDVILKDVVANIGLELTGLPSLGDNSKFYVDLKAELPSFVKPSSLDIKGEIKNGKFTNQPIDIKGFDLSGYNFQEMKSKGENLSGTVKVAGRIYAENPEVQLSSITGTVNGTFKANISGPDNKIKVKNLSAKLDYQIDTTFTIDMSEFSKKMEKVNFDLPEITAILGMKTNLAIPVSAQARIVPVKGVQEDKSKTIVADLQFPYSSSPSQTDTVTNTLKLNLNDILNSKCDSVRTYIDLKLDNTRDCYIEPEAKYTLGLGYDVNIPLQLGVNTSVVLADTLDLDGALSDSDGILANSSFGLVGEVETTFPVGIKVKMEFLSYDEVEDVYTRVPLKPIDTDLIKPNTTTKFNILTGPETPGKELPEVTHLRISCILSSDGKPLGPDSYVKFSNIALVLPDGITIDSESKE